MKQIENLADISKGVWPQHFFRRNEKTRSAFLLRNIPKTSVHLLDIGYVGQGDLKLHNQIASAVLASDGQVTGVDLQTPSQELAPNTKHLNGSVYSIPLPDSSIDVCHFGEVLEHLYDPAKAIGEIWRVLRPEGILLLTTPNALSWKYMLRWWLFQRELLGGAGEHVMIHTPASLASVVISSPFTITEMQTAKDGGLFSLFPQMRHLGAYLMLRAQARK